MLHEATRLLRCFNAELTDMSVGEAANRLDLQEDAARDLIEAMHAAGLLQGFGEQSQRYRPGPLALDLAAAYRSASALITDAIDAVSATCQACGHTGFVTVLDGADATAVFSLPGAAANRVPLRVSRLPAMISASGRTLLARLDDSEIEGLHPQLDRGAMTSLIARLDVLRDEGYEVSRSESRAGVESVAVAVEAPTEGTTVSLCIKYPADGIDCELRHAIINGLLEGAGIIAQRVGDAAFSALGPVKGIADHP